MFQPNSQPFYLEAIAEELAQIGDEFNREFEYARESFSGQEFLLLLNEVTQRRRSPDDSYEVRDQVFFWFHVWLCDHFYCI